MEPASRDTNPDVAPPRGVVERHVTLPDARYRVWSAGDPAAPVVLLVHGLGWDALRLWHEQMQLLGQAGWHVLAPDLPGVGGSSPLTSPRAPRAFATELADLLAALGHRECAVAGFSMGGTVALEMAALPGSPVRAAAICCTGGPNAADQSADVEAMLARVSALGPEGFAREQADAIWHPDWAHAHPSEVSDFIGWRSRMDQASLSNAFRSNALASGPVVPARCPHIVIASDNDVFVAVDEARRVADQLGEADFVLIEDSGHMAPIEQPAAFDAALRAFLTTHWPARSARAA